MFDKNFFPTPIEVIMQMLEGETLQGKTILEPHVGKGDIADVLTSRGAHVLGCELNPDLQKIAAFKCTLIGDDFLQLRSDEISHIDMIVMNPPFDNAHKHILHAFEIAPAGCKIIALCNAETIENDYYLSRKELKSLIFTYGYSENIGDCFSTAERKTNVNIRLVKLQKPGVNYETEFEGFCMEEEPVDAGSYGIMKYDFIRDLVQRYIGAVKIYDEQIDAATRMNALMKGFYSSKIAMSITEDGKPKARTEFKKDLQKNAWLFIFDKLKMQKYSTKGLKEDINKQIETQIEIPFTMKNIYHMLDMVIQTNGQRMDKAILEVFDKLTQHHEDNRYNVKGWKTNSHFLMGKKFILPYMVANSTGSRIALGYGYNNFDLIEDFLKAVCRISGDDYDMIINLRDFLAYKYRLQYMDGQYVRNTFGRIEGWDQIDDRYAGILHKQKELAELGRPTTIEKNELLYGQWMDWTYFRIKAYKKGTMHFEFKDEDLWARLNQNIARIKGYPLFEAKEQTAYQQRNTGRKKSA